MHARFLKPAALMLALLFLCGCAMPAQQAVAVTTDAPSAVPTAAPTSSSSPEPTATPEPTNTPEQMPTPTEAPTPAPGPPDGYTLALSDEFDGDAIDESVWTYELGAWPYNKELEYYTADNAFIEGGCLVIEARLETVENRSYTSARLKTEEKFDFTYGYLEVRAALPVATGTWSAIWLLPTDTRYGGYLHSGEIDIVERVGYDAKLVHATVHTFENNSVDGDPISAYARIGRRDASFHIYGFLWTEDTLQILLDGNETLRYERPENADYTVWPFDVPFHLILNVAVGGSWGGIKGVDDEAFPQRMLVDYVRYYIPPDADSPE